jgi:hypothetical protein
VIHNKEDNLFSGERLVLEWAYRTVYEALWRMEHGTGFRPEVARMLNECSPQLNEERWLAELRAEQRDLEEFIPKNLPEEDWAIRRRAEIARELKALSEPELFARLMRANTPRTVRKLVTQSIWLRSSRLGVFLREQPERFIAIKADRRFPKSSDKRIDFLARSIGAALARYRPSTGRRYLARIEKCDQCGELPAVINLIRDRKVYSWCGAC